MSRDFDARVRDLNEAPLSLERVRDKAVAIRRNRRIAAAGGLLAVAAVITPVAVIATTGGGDSESRPPVASQDVEDPTTASAPDYIVDGVWHQADGDDVEIPDGDYYSAVLWDDHLVVQGPEETDVSISVAQVIDAGGELVDTFDSNQGIAVSEDGSVLAYVSRTGQLVTRWADGELSIAGDLDINHSVTAVTGSGQCGTEDDVCSVYVNDGDGPPTVYTSQGEQEDVVADATKYADAAGVLVTATNDVTAGGSCGGVYSLDGRRYLWQTCDFQVQDISPDRRYVAAPPAYLSGFGASQIAIVDAVDGPETTPEGDLPAGQWAADGADIVAWEWSTDGRLVFTAYDGASWHLYAMKPNGAVEELVDPIRGSDLDNPFTLIQH